MKAFSIKRILVPLDFSPCSLLALDYALALAEQCHAGLTLLHAVEPAAPARNFAESAAGLDQTNEALVEAGKERLAGIVRKRVGHRVPAESLVRLGHASSEIADTAEAMGIDLVVLGASGSTALQHPGLGNTAERVVRQAHCPVLTVPLRSPSHGE